MYMCIANVVGIGLGIRTRKFQKRIYYFRRYTLCSIFFIVIAGAMYIRNVHTHNSAGNKLSGI